MEKKYILILIIGIIFIGLATVALFSISGNTFSIGSETFSVPDNYTIQKQSEKSVTLVNEKNKKILRVNIPKYNSINDIVTDYHKKHENDTVKEENMTINNVSLKCLTLIQNNKTVHYNYYYEKNKVIYHIYSQDNNKTALKQLLSNKGTMFGKWYQSLFFLKIE